MRNLGCLLILAIVAAAAYFTRDRWLPRVMHEPPPPAASARAEETWQALTPAGAARARTALARLERPTGPVFERVRPGDLAAFVSTALAKQLPASADSVEAAAIGDRLFLRASVRLGELGGSGALGPLGSILGDRERMTIGGRVEVLRPGLAQFHVDELRLRDLKVPKGAIPRIIRQIRRGDRPEGVSEDALPLEIPAQIGDVRVENGRVILYKSRQQP